MASIAPAGFGEDFLHWLQEVTEDAWAQVEEWTPADFRAAGYVGYRWRRGTRWTGGLAEQAVIDVEERLGIRFPPQHRLFLRTLHSTTPWQRGASYVGRELRDGDHPGFYDWLRDEPQIRAVTGRVGAGIVADVEDGFWLAAWGSPPDTELGRRTRVRELLAAAPELLPIYGHRHVVAGTDVVLSVHQTDIIVYGDDLRAYLLAELHDLLGIEPPPVTRSPDRVPIPFWDELIYPESTDGRDAGR